MSPRLATLCALLLATCAEPQRAPGGLRLTLSQVPAAARYLRLTLSPTDGAPGARTQRELPDTGRRDGVVTVDLQLSGAAGRVRVLAQVHGGSVAPAEGACPLAQGEAESEGDQALLALGPPACAAGEQAALALERVTPPRGPADAETEVVLRGGGFAPDLQVQVDGAAVPVTVRSPGEATIRIPKAADPTKVLGRPVAIELRRPGVAPLRRDDLFVYYERLLRLQPFGHVYSFEGTTGSGAGLGVADLNADGKPDVVMPVNSNRHAVLFGGAGGLGAPTLLTPPAPLVSHYHYVFLADIDGDGQRDLIYALDTYALDRTSGTRVMVRPGRKEAATRFGDDVYVATSVAPSGFINLSLVELRSKGVFDLVLLNEERGDGMAIGTTYLYVSHSDGRGRYTLQRRCSLLGLRDPLHMVTADFDGDGALDLLASYNSAGTSLTLITSGPTLDDGCGPQSELPLAGRFPLLAAGDVDGDGLADVAVTPTLGTEILRSRGNGTFQRGWQTFGGLSQNGTMLLSDLNGDRRADLVYARNNAAGSGQLEVRLARDDGFPLEPDVKAELTVQRPSSPGVNPGFQAAPLVATDMDGDGRPDLVISAGGPAGGASIFVLRNLPVSAP